MQAGIIYLGVGASAPQHDRGLTSFALLYRGSVYVFDVGEGTQERLAKAGISPLRIRAVFITHLHGDHFFGLPGLLQSMTLASRREQLVIVAPKGLEDYLASAEKVTGHIRSFDISIVEVKPGRVYSDDNIIVEAFPVCHGGLEAYGFVIREQPRPGRLRVELLERLGLKPGPYLSRLKKGEPVVINGKVLRPEEFLEPARRGFKIVYTGDTRPCVSTIEAAGGADILIHDATFLHKDLPEARSKGHSTAREAARVAMLARVKCLALIHFSARYRSLQAFEKEASMHARCVYAALPGMIHVLRI